MNIAKTIKNLQKDVQSHKADNVRLMRAKEQQYDFNMELLEGLNIIENKLDKESGSSKSESHRSPDEKRRTRSVRRHHHHSPRHSNKRAHNKSSPSLVNNHNRHGVDEVRGEMNKMKPPTFDGEHKKDEDAETWLLGMKVFSIA